MMRYVIFVNLTLGIIPLCVNAQELKLSLPSKPACQTWREIIDAVDKSGCTAIRKEKYALGANNSPDKVALENYKHDTIKYLTYHHSALAKYKRDGTIDVDATKELIKNRPFSMGIGEQVKNIQSGHIKRETPMFSSDGPKIKWGDIAYHYIVDRFGNIVEGRQIKYVQRG